MSKNSDNVRRTQVYFISMIIVLMLLSFITLLQAFKTYKERGYMDYLSFALSISAITLSVYMILQIKTKPPKTGFEQPEVFTVIRCSKCGFEITRKFKEGDYVLKEADPCPKCKEPTFIYMIFRKADEEEKKRERYEI